MEKQETLEKAGVAHMAEAPVNEQPHPNLPAPEAEEDDYLTATMVGCIMTAEVGQYL